MAKKREQTVSNNNLNPTTSQYNEVVQDKSSDDLLFHSVNYKLILLGMAVMALGYLLMAGGHMPSPDVWDEDIIYSFRRITLAPIVILIGLGIEVYAIFKR